MTVQCERHFTADATTTLNTALTWHWRAVRIDGADGTPIFAQRVYAPDSWSERALRIVAQKYLRVVDGERETDISAMLHRVCRTMRDGGCTAGYFHDDACAQRFYSELYHILLHQMASFNSPVWFNLGVDDPPNVSACYILDVEDSMESILQWVHDEAIIFRGGSGAGVNLSKLRPRNAPISKGGKASGPVSFMQFADAGANAIKSGGTTRRSAKMVILDWDHPDIEEFIWCKAKAEKMAHELGKLGHNDGVESELRQSLPFQNANNSVSMTDVFMREVANPPEHSPRAGLFRDIANAAWQCGDPGLFFKDAVNTWHTTPGQGDIVSSNPCGEFLRPPNEACNLASINLLKFLKDDGAFDITGFCHTVDILITAMDILVDLAQYPTEAITQNSRNYRTLGLGYSNLGALLMAIGAPYDSDDGRSWAGAITSLMTARAYYRSAALAKERGAFAGFTANRDAMLAVIDKHETATAFYGRSNTVWDAAYSTWAAAQHLGETYGYRNAQVTLIAPTGTISFMMDCDTTGIEPCLDLVTEKQLVGGGTMRMVNQSVKRGLKALGYTTAQMDVVSGYLESGEDAERASCILDTHRGVFATALGVNALPWKAHIDMVAAVQPFLSGGVSKTINMPHDATVEDVEAAYIYAWQKGLKLISIYRDGCKNTQPVVSAMPHVDDSVAQRFQREIIEAARGPENFGFVRPEHGCGGAPVVVCNGRTRLPVTRNAITHKFTIAGHEGYLTVGMFPSCQPGEVFIKMAKEGSTVSGLMDTIGILTSMLLQYGVPLDILVDKLSHMRFEPAGFTGNTAVPQASSIVDYVFRWLSHEFGGAHVVAQNMPAPGDNERNEIMAGTVVPIAPEWTHNRTGVSAASTHNRTGVSAASTYAGETYGGLVRQHAQRSRSSTPTDAPVCGACGSLMTRRTGSCFVCDVCGNSAGCS